MKTLLAFVTALTDPQRLRILHLASGHWRSAAELEGVLKLPSSEVATHVEVLTQASILKARTQKTGVVLRVKHRHQSLVEQMFAHFLLSAKAVKSLKQDTKLAKQWHEAVAKKAKASKDAKKAAKVKASDKPKTSGKAKAKGDTKKAKPTKPATKA